ncbi:hypothetical protein FRC09_020165 [Ceratobasidium sp. 395]|nr:hypothetical protein FRC09_020165 [Ceratobasidium sp. 395]
MVRFTVSVFTLLATVTFVGARRRSEATKVYTINTYLNRTAAKLERRLKDREVWLQQEYINAHNSERVAHGASPLTWDDELSASAAAWANQCKFKHSQTGQNLAAGTGDPTPATAVGWWNDERADYDPANPKYSHWTQVVWKSTERLGCAMASCASGTVLPTEDGDAAISSVIMIRLET